MGNSQKEGDQYNMGKYEKDTQNRDFKEKALNLRLYSVHKRQIYSPLQRRMKKVKKKEKPAPKFQKIQSQKNCWLSC